MSARRFGTPSTRPRPPLTTDAGHSGPTPTRPRRLIDSLARDRRRLAAATAAAGLLVGLVLGSTSVAAAGPERAETDSATIDQLTSEVDHLGGELAAVRDELATTEQDLEEATAQVAEIDRRTADLEALETTMTTRQQELDARQADLDTRQGQLDARAADLDAREASVTAAEARTRSSGSTSSATGSTAGSRGTAVFENCDAARAEGAAPVRRGDPGYGPHLDRDNDGIGCE